MTPQDEEPKKAKTRNHIMKNRNIHLPSISVILTSVILLVFETLASPSQAEAAQTYHGTLTGGTFLCDGTPVNGPIVTGTWNVIIDPQTPAQVTLNVFYNGGHHLAFGYNALMQVSFVNGVYVFSGFGDAATATLDTTANPATFSWHVELGVSCPDQNPYNSLTYFGVADRGR
jgi:hypothetical protein